MLSQALRHVRHRFSGDLMPTYPTQAEMEAHYGSTNPTMGAQGCFGQSDAKIFNFQDNNNQQGGGGLSSLKSYVSYITNGPTNDQQPVFEWGGSCGGKIPSRVFKKMDFPWVKLSIPNDDLSQ